MDEQTIKVQVNQGEAASKIEEKTSSAAPATPPNTGPLRRLPTYAWWLVLGLVGLDCFSTLGYLPTVALEGSRPPQMAPLAAVAVSLLLLFAVLPVYLYIVGRSPHGQGATGLLESRVSGWGGKILILILLGFVAANFVLTRTLSTADASTHLLANPHVQDGVDWLMGRKIAVYHALPAILQDQTTERIFDWWDEQLVVTILLMLLFFAFFFYLMRGFTRGFLYAAAAVVFLFLALNGLILVSAFVYVAHRPEYITNWMELIRFGSANRSALGFTEDLFSIVIRCLPAVILGLSGFELSTIVAPLVRGRSDDDPIQPRHRIRNMRKLLVTVAVVMSLLVPASITAVMLLVPAGALQKNGDARDRALAYLAHGGVLQPPGRRVSTDNPVRDEEDDFDDDADMAAPPPAAVKPADNEADDDEVAPRQEVKTLPPPDQTTSADVNPLFGPTFGTLYDITTVLILCLAGASVTISLRDLLPHYLTRYGMAMHWAQRVGVLLHLFNAIVLIAVIAFHARVSHQQNAYAASVLALLAAAALAAIVDLYSRKRRSRFRSWATALVVLIGMVFLLRASWTGAMDALDLFLALLLLLGLFVLVNAPFILISMIFLSLACWIAWMYPAGLLLVVLFVVVLFVSAGLSRWLRSTELRFDGFTFADEESGVRWEAIRRLEFQVLVAHQPNHLSLAEKESRIRARHRLAADVPIVFVEAELGDPSDFQQHPLLRVVRENGQEVIRVSQCTSVAHVLAAIALEFRTVGQPPEIHFAWSEESPLASNLNFLLWGHGNVPWMVHALIRRAEPEAALRPRVVIA